MSLVTLPFYQKRHKHFDQSYRNIQTRYLLDEYAAKKRTSTRSSSQKTVAQKSSSQRASSQTAEGATTCRICAKRVSAALEEEEAQETKRRYRSLVAAYGEAKRERFLRELAQLEEDVHLARSHARDELDRYALQHMVDDRLAWDRPSYEERLSRAPEILVRLRSHTVWERMPVKLCFTVQGFPTPVVQWYKDGSLICQAGEPGKYRIESKYGVHTLEINRADFDDSATYSAVATNVHGQVSTNAAVVVRRFRGDEEPFRSVGLPIGLPPSSVIPYMHFDVQFVEKFGVTFRREGETLTLKCSLLVTPDLKRVQPRAEWYRDDVLLKESQWTKMFFGEGQASLSFSHLNKDDEGLYTLRIVSRGGVRDHSAFLFVRDADPLVTGAPGAPMDLQCHDANRDYVIVTWKPPNTTTESPVLGYFIDRCEVGTDNWVQCNDAPVKICKYPVTGLLEGRSYIFRVRAVNSAGTSRPSRVSEAVAALDPLDLKRLHAAHLGGHKETVTYQDDLEGEVQIPAPPTNVHISETSRTYVVLSWDPPAHRGKDPLMYFIEKSVVGSGSWQRVNAQTAVRSPRYAVFDLADGKSYVFRVLSANKHGLSDPSEITAPVQAQDTIAVPSAPGRVLASRNTKTSVVVQWDRPKHEEDLLGYYVDCCVAGSKVWEPCNHKPIGYNRFVVHGLTTGEQYIFRVKAVNAVGTSENSQESDVIKVQAALTVPSYPYGITLLNCDGHSMTLGWKVPRFSGGSPILGYYVDKREAHHTNWHEVNALPLKERILTVEGLTEGSTYEFKIAAANLVGIGEPSDPSEPFRCEAWTAPQPGPAYDLTFCEVRDTSLVMLWKAPVYSGSSPISGYFVDYKEEDSGEWITVNEAATTNRYLKVCDLHQGKTYVFRVRAVNASGVGRPSDTSEPVLVEARPGTKEVSAGVDEEGNIYLSFDCQEMTDASHFTWCKSYEDIAGDERFRVETVGDHSKLYFKNPDKSDAGTYSVSVSDTDGVSSSLVLDEEELDRLMALSNEIKNPTIPLKSELAYEIFDKGRVRFWLQAEHLSPDASYRFIINDREVSDSEAHRIKCDKSTGIVEMVMDRFTDDNEGTYTVQLHDGKAKSQSSLVLIGDAFKAVLKEAEFQRKEFLRKQGPHFAEYLHWDVTDKCEVRLVCKVANTKKETVFKWLKDDVLYETDKAPDLEKGVCELLIPKLSKKDHGEYKATLKDERGQDVSVLEVAGKVYEDMILAMSRVCGASASPLKVLCTPEGIRLQCFVKYFMEEMKVNWYHKDAKIASSEHMRTGGSEEMAWLQICEPTEKDKGKYTFEIFDGKDKHQRSLDLSGQAFDEAFAEFQQLKAAAFAEKNRGKVIGGLPDVVTIMEGKTLNLTCTVFGNPDPEVVWYKNDKDIELSEHFQVKVEQAKYVSMTIKGVTSEDSGRYSMSVKNKYGGEKIDVTVSVYKHGEPLPDVAPPQQARPKLIPASATSPTH
ncbi:myomesin-2 [Camelus dromedarius]|uniref:myomesin-2 n=1 Tax=Camelus dromedarius TaxID=9838 RepID=UPI001263D54F|nr:myomesin-2 [Camelus dromedarius]XP_031296239.1 myomesin-2 [Camelus dromedarius]